MTVCTKEEQATRKFKAGKPVKDANNARTCNAKPQVATIKTEGDKIKASLNFIKKADCSCSGSWGEWGDWLPGGRTVIVNEGACKWSVKYTWEVRGRTYTGICVTTSIAQRVTLWEYDAEADRDIAVKLSPEDAKQPFEGETTGDSGFVKDQG